MCMKMECENNHTMKWLPTLYTSGIKIIRFMCNYHQYTSLMKLWLCPKKVFQQIKLSAVLGCWREPKIMKTVLRMHMESWSQNLITGYNISKTTGHYISRTTSNIFSLDPVTWQKVDWQQSVLWVPMNSRVSKYMNCHITETSCTM